jgi:hypothetical protein
MSSSTTTAESQNQFPVWTWLTTSRIRLRQQSVPRPTRWQIAGWVAVLVVASFISLHDYDSFQLAAYRDDAVYIILARSLVHGPTYGFVNQPDVLSARTFPFGFPLLLTPVEVLFPETPTIYPVISLIATWLNIALLFWGWPWFNRRSSHWWGLATTALYALSPLTIGHTRATMSEPAFLCACLSAMLLTERYEQANSDIRWLLGLAVASVFVLFTRTVGIAFAVAIVANLLYVHGRSIWKALVGLIISFVSIIALIIAITPLTVSDLMMPTERYLQEYEAFVSDQDRHPTLTGLSYSEAVFSLAERHVRRAWRPVLLPIGGGASEQQLFTNWRLPWIPVAVNISLVTLTLFGAAVELRRSGPALFWTSAFAYYGLISLWNWGGSRFLYPIQPQLYFGFLVGVWQVYRWLTSLFKNNLWLLHLARWGLIAAAIGWGSLFIFRSWTITNSRSHLGDVALRTEWLRANIEADAIVLTEVPDIDYIYGQRSTLPFPNPALTPAELLVFLQANRVNYVLVAPFSTWQETYVPSYTAQMTALIPELEQLAKAGQLQKIYDSPADMIAVYKVVKFRP